jgi:hypothetical protein
MCLTAVYDLARALQSVVFITGDHGDSNPIMDGRGEYGHGQPESSWWQQKVSVPLWMCLPGDGGAAKSAKPATPATIAKISQPGVSSFPSEGSQDRGGVAAPYAGVTRDTTGVQYRPPLQRLELAGGRGEGVPQPLPLPTAHVDIMPTMLAVLGASSVPHWLYSHGFPLVASPSPVNGQLVLVRHGGARRNPAHSASTKSSSNDDGRERALGVVVFNPRHFPERDKVAGVVTASHKLWFRVSSYDVTTRAMAFRPERLSDLSDDHTPCGTLSSLRSVYQQRCEPRLIGVQRRVGDRTLLSTPVGDCAVAVDDTCDALLVFVDEFWRFFRPIQ